MISVHKLRSGARVGLLVCLLLLMATIVGAQDTPQQTIHVVQRGETLFRIAQQYGLTTDSIARANNIINPSNILVGQRLLIPLTVEVALEVPEVYIVRPADTLVNIAQAFNLEVSTLTALNGLENPNAIYAGQSLLIRGTLPEVPTDGSAPEITDVVEAQLPTTTLVHRVQPGDNLFSIAQRFGVTMESIQSANQITDPSRILVGQELQIVGVPLPGPQANLPPGVINLDVSPADLGTGKTARIRLETTAASSVAVNFLDRATPVTALDPQHHIAFAPVPLGTVPGIYPMTVSVTDLMGVNNTVSFNIQINDGGYGAQYVTLPAEKLPLLTQAVEDNEMSILQRLTTPYTPDRYFDGPMGLPAAAPMFSAFGAKRAYNGNPLDHYHTGSDFAGAPGTPIIAPAPGRVVLADTLNIRGTAVILDHGWGVYSLYAHMSERYVNLGDFVQAGTTLGAIGSTGRATGAHLHWEIWVSGVPVDPMQWVSQAFP